jgi:hypothetical protein
MLVDQSNGVCRVCPFTTRASQPVDVESLSDLNDGRMLQL